MGFLFYFFISRFPSYFRALFLLNAAPTLCRSSKLSFGSNWIQKPKTSIYEILRVLFSNMDFNFAYFANFNFAHFEIEESFGLIWEKLQKGRFHLQTSNSSIYFCSFCL